LTDQVRSLETNNLQLESEVRSLKLALDHEKSERRHYQFPRQRDHHPARCGRPDLDDVVKRAEHDVYRKRRETPRAELPEAELPTFLRKVEALVNGPGEKPKALP
jgi:hypothetical protein